MEDDVRINRMVVVDLGLDEDIAEQLLTMDRNIHPPYSAPYRLLSLEASGFAFMDRRVTETVPLLIDSANIQQLAGIPVTETALTRRFPPDDQELVCERIKHLMIRLKHFDQAKFDAIMSKLEAGISNVADLPFWETCLARYYYHLLGAGLYLEWDLLQNLETLCIDMNGKIQGGFLHWLETRVSEMSEYLNLKTLILVGIPCLARYDVPHSNGGSGEEFWVSYLEEEWEIPEPGTDELDVNYLVMFKWLMRPGGQIHFVEHLGPGGSYWPGPVNGIVELDDGLQ
ncbi:hypothetical protein IL306_010217 [Fusarium sp. DS 682]|nr:hypothetical protein IL306_010217 [Fusarium sp. DS 682]